MRIIGWVTQIWKPVPSSTSLNIGGDQDGATAPTASEESSNDSTEPLGSKSELNNVGVGDQLEVDNIRPMIGPSLPAFPVLDYREIGSLAAANRSGIGDAKEHAKEIYEQSRVAIEKTKKNFEEEIERRITLNESALKTAESRKTELLLKRDEVQQKVSSNSEELQNSFEEFAAARLEAVTILRSRQQENLTLRQSKPEDDCEMGERSPIFLIEDNMTHNPFDQKEGLRGFLWVRSRQYSKLHKESQELVTALSNNGITDQTARFFSWAGSILLLGAGGAIGSLLQQSEIGNHFIERILASVQSRLGFQSPSISTESQSWGVLQVLPGILAGLIIILALVLVVAGFFALAAKLAKWLGVEAEKEDPQVPHITARDAPADATPWSKGVLALFVRGESLFRYLPGLSVFLVGLVLFLAFSPSFDETARNANDALSFSITRTSIGFVFAVAAVALSHLLLTIGLYPALVARLKRGESITVATPRSVIIGFLAALLVTVTLIGIAPTIVSNKAPSGATGLLQNSEGPRTEIGNPGAPVSSPATSSNRSGENLARNPSPTPKPLAPQLVWLSTSFFLLFSSLTLSFAIFLGGLFSRARYIADRFYRYELQYVQQLESNADNKSKKGPLTIGQYDEILITQPEAYCKNVNDDVVLKRIFTLGLLKPNEFESLKSLTAKLLKQGTRLEALRIRLGEITAEIASNDSRIDSLQRSTRNYKNRILALKVEEDSLLLLQLARYKNAIRELQEGFDTMRAVMKKPLSQDPDDGLSLNNANKAGVSTEGGANQRSSVFENDPGFHKFNEDQNRK